MSRKRNVRSGFWWNRVCFKGYYKMSLSTSPEFYVNMKNPPVWNDLFGWEDQDDDVKQFFKEEAYKVKYGVTINGTFISMALLAC